MYRNRTVDLLRRGYPWGAPAERASGGPHAAVGSAGRIRSAGNPSATSRPARYSWVRVVQRGGTAVVTLVATGPGRSGSPGAGVRAVAP